MTTRTAEATELLALLYTEAETILTDETENELLVEATTTTRDGEALISSTRSLSAD